MKTFFYYFLIFALITLSSCKDEKTAPTLVETTQSTSGKKISATKKWQNIRSSNIEDIAIENGEIYALRTLKNKQYISNFLDGKWKNTATTNTKVIEYTNDNLYKLFSKGKQDYIAKLNNNKWEESKVPTSVKFSVANNTVYGLESSGKVYELKNNKTTFINHKNVKDIAFDGSSLYLLKKNAKGKYIIAKTKDKSFRNINANNIHQIFFENGNLYANKKTKNGDILLKRENNKWTNTKIRNVKMLEVANGAIYALRTNKKVGRNILSYKRI